MVQNCHSIDDLRSLAKRRLPAPVFGFLDGGAETEGTMRRNIAAFDDWPLLPRCLADVTTVSTRTRVLGQDVDWPIICSPTGASRVFHPDGELAVARAAGRAGVTYGLSSGSTFSLEAVAAASEGPKLFQLYISRNREVSRGLVRRAKAAGYGALCLTVDASVLGKRERDLRSGFNMPLRLKPRSIASFALHPRWALGQLAAGPFQLANFLDAPGRRNGFAVSAKRFGDSLDTSIGWDDVREFATLWDGPFAIKGIMSPQDARQAADAGATAIIVSNHGGRQLDGAAAAIDALPAIVDAVGHRVDVILDSGIRRGVHILKALALGAKACMVGRPYLYGLAAGGEAGAHRAIDLLQTELVTAMRLSGCRDVTEAGRDLLAPPRRIARSA